MKKTILAILSLLLGTTACLADDASITIDNTVKYQHVSGFGGFSPSPSWSYWLNDSDIDLLFGKGENQLGYTIMRTYIATNKNFWRDGMANIRRAKSHGTFIFASPWSPPASWKDNNNESNGGKLLTSRYKDWANWLNDYYLFTKEQGAAIDAVSVQNEPDWKTEYQSCVWTGQELANFLKGYGSLIQCKVIAPESVHFTPNLHEPMLNDAAACAQLDILGGHFYGWNGASYPLAAQKGKEVWMTEYLINERQQNNNLNIDWKNDGFLFAKSVNDAMLANFSAWVHYSLKRYYGCIGDGNFGTTNGQVTKRGYILSHYAKYVSNTTRVKHTLSDRSGNLSTSAYLSSTGDSIIVMVMNNGSKSFNTTLTLPFAAAAGNHIVTTENVNMKKTPLSFATETRTPVVQVAPYSVNTFIFSNSNGANSTTATAFGNAKYDSSNGHYCFYTTNYSAFIFSNFSGKELVKCADLTIDLGNESTTGYRLDVQLKDKNGNIIKDGDNNYIIGSEAAGTRLTSATDKTYNLQEIFAKYIDEYPGCTIGDIRLNTSLASEDSDRAGKYFITIDNMKMNVSQVTARAASLTKLAEVPMKRYTDKENFVINDNCESGNNFNSWGNGAVTRKSGAGTNDSYGFEVVVSEKKNSWEGQFCITKPDLYTEGTEYTLRFDIKGSVSGTIHASFQKSEGYGGRGDFPTISVGTSWSTVTVKTTVTGPDADRLLLSYGDYLGTINIDNIQVFTTEGVGTEIAGNNIRLNTSCENGAEVFGAGLSGLVLYNEYADLSEYKKMVIKGSGGNIRVLFNRLEDNTLIELTPSLASGSTTINLDDYPYFHLNSIKAAWGNTVNVSEIILTGDNDANEFADYYIEGAGSHAQSAVAALNDDQATIIDITGYTGKFVDEFASANPNCLIIYAEDKIEYLGGDGPYDSRNTVKKSKNDYSAWRIDLFDNYSFRSAIEINTVGGASYTRDLNTEWATAVLPFDLDVEAENSPEIFVLSSVDDEQMNFARKESGTIAAGNVILYRNTNKGTTTLSGTTIRPTAEGYNIQPVAGVDGWFTAQSLTHAVIEDVAADPVLKIYDVYGIKNDELVHATKRLTLNPFRAFYLHRKDANAKSRYGIAIEEASTAITKIATNAIATESARYNAAGQLLSSPRPGINIIRMSDGTVKKEIR